MNESIPSAPTVRALQFGLDLAVVLLLLLFLGRGLLGARGGLFIDLDVSALVAFAEEDDFNGQIVSVNWLEPLLVSDGRW